MKAKFLPEQFVEIKWNKRIAQNKTFCSVFLCLSHSFIFFQDKVLEFFINNPLRNPHNPLPLPALQIPHAQSLDYTNPIITLSGTTQLEKTHVVERGPPRISLASFKSKSNKRRGALSKIQCFITFNRKGADLK